MEQKFTFLKKLEEYKKQQEEQKIQEQETTQKKVQTKKSLNAKKKFNEEATRRFVNHIRFATFDSSLISILENCLNDGADINGVIEGETALIYAAWRCSFDLCDFLIENGADIDFQDNLGYTALMYAVENGDEEIVELLVEKGADINSTNRTGLTAIDIAKNNYNYQIEECLKFQLNAQQKKLSKEENQYKF